MSLNTTGLSGDHASLAALIAARVASAGIPLAEKLPERPVVADPNALRTDMPNVKTFIGPCNACLWFDGRKSEKRFSSNGVYLTDNPMEISQLRTMMGVSELTPEVALGAV